MDTLSVKCLQSPFLSEEGREDQGRQRLRLRVSGVRPILAVMGKEGAGGSSK